MRLVFRVFPKEVPMILHTGLYEIGAVTDGVFRLDGGAMFGVVPKTMWEKDMHPDLKNRIELALRCMLIQGEGRRVLVETGIGDKFDPKKTGIYGIDHEKGRLLASLGELGLAPDDITDVILTHLHFDHSGGATMQRDGRVVPTFPKAKHWVQRANLEHARKPIEHDRASYLAENFAPLEDAGLLEPVDGEKEILEGITVTPVDGHTVGMQVVTVAGPEDTVVFCADLVPTSSHIRIPWNMAYDLNPRRTIDEKKRLFAAWCERRTLLYFYHDPVYAGARLERDGENYKPVDRVRG